MMFDRFKFSGAMPANLLPFNEDYTFDVPNYRRHLSWLADVEGVPAIVCNGHASEVSSLTQDERQRALAFALEEVGGQVLFGHGLHIAWAMTSGRIAGLVLSGKEG